MAEDRLVVNIATKPGGKVLVNLEYPGTNLAMELTCVEARSIARALLSKADEAEAPNKSGEDHHPSPAKPSRWPLGRRR
jgi:hypothetical protein